MKQHRQGSHDAAKDAPAQAQDLLVAMGQVKPLGLIWVYAKSCRIDEVRLSYASSELCPRTVLAHAGLHDRLVSFASGYDL